MDSSKFLPSRDYYDHMGTFQDGVDEIHHSKFSSRIVLQIISHKVKGLKNNFLI